jgi:non-specific serine/threonine protein kinase/serine/threonine-protein kinase
MTPEQWEELKGGLHAALELDPANRSACVEAFARRNPELRREIESLLASYLAMKTDFLHESETTATVGESGAIGSLVGRQLGPYRVVEPIGSGGMGEVFRAVRADDQYQKEVAIKIVRAGADSAFVVSRFKNERQILASLDHPNIARLLDGGATADGLPYLVMELVEGVRIDTYCDQHKLTTTDRLKLILQVYSAVQYAHQRLIIHRDIKPGNILVTPDGVPKLLDFGIAKILDPGSFGSDVENTMTLFRLLTPAYASPEQVLGAPITTASDVYSLGVILYELLTGRSPYGVHKRSSDELSRAVCEFDPERPSTTVTRSLTNGEGKIITAEQISAVRGGSPQKLRKRLRGDLDTIALVALRKEPHRRYSSVEVFAADISRHLQDLPVVARGDSARYRARKFVVRHRAAVSVVIAASLALVIGLAIAVREARIAHTERARAEQRFKDVRELANSDLFELHDAIQQLPGSASARNMVIQRALKYLEKLSRDAADDRNLMEELTTGYERVAALQGNFSGPGIGDTAAALTSYEKALELREALVASSKGDFNQSMAELRLMGAYDQVLQTAAKTGKAKRIAEQAVQISEQLRRVRPTDAPGNTAAALAHLQLASVLGGNGSSPSTREITGAISHDQQALGILEGTGGIGRDSNTQASAVKVKMFLAQHLNKARRFDEAEGILSSILEDEKQRTALAPYLVADVYEWRGLIFERAGDQERALADYRQNKNLVQKLVTADPHDMREQLDFQIAKAHIAMQMARLGLKGPEINELDIAVSNGEQMFAANPAKLVYRILLSEGYCYQAELFFLAGKRSGALTQYSKALEMLKDMRNADPDDFESRLHIGKIYDALGVVYATGGEHDRARDEFDTAQQALNDLLQMRPQDAETEYALGLVLKHSAENDACSKEHSCAARSWQLTSPIN